tara:strand:+ start:309 stop:506 length:198 start_codon:yes stop_codon:yes gene_type:complete
MSDNRFRLHETILQEVESLPESELGWLDTEVGSDISLSDSTKRSGYCNDCGETIDKCSGYKCWIK